MAYQIDQRKVTGVVLEANSVLNNKGFNHGEVIIGLAELIGRIIVEASDGAIQAKELTKVAVVHIENTIKIGGEAREKSLIERV